MADYRNSGGGLLVGLLTMFVARRVVKSDAYQNVTSGLGTAGRSFFTLGVLTLASAFFFANPVTFGILAGIGGASMLIGLGCGVMKVIRSRADAEPAQQNQGQVPDPTSDPANVPTENVYNSQPQVASTPHASAPSFHEVLPEPSAPMLDQGLAAPPSYCPEWEQPPMVTPMAGYQPGLSPGQSQHWAALYTRPPMPVHTQSGGLAHTQARSYDRPA